jgi:hypothetical protein
MGLMGKASCLDDCAVVTDRNPFPVLDMVITDPAR